MSGDVRDARPPAVLLRILNPVVKVLLRSPASRVMPSLALLEFTRRRSNRPVAVAVGFHTVDGKPVVFSPAPWRENFAGGHPASVRHRGRRREAVGTLVRDPSEVAAAIGAVIRDGTSARALGLRVPDGHTITTDDVSAMGRAMVVLRWQPEGVG